MNTNKTDWLAIGLIALATLLAGMPALVMQISSAQVQL